MALLVGGAGEGNGKGPSEVWEWAALFQRPKEWCGRLAEGQRAAGGCVLVLIGVVAVVFFVSAKGEAWWWALVGEQL